MITIHPVTTPPITESITGGKRHTTCKKSVVFQCSFIIMSISHKIPVLSPLGMFTSLHPIPVIRITIEKKIVGVIYASPSVFCKKPIFQIRFVPPTLIPIPSVECTSRAFQIILLLHTWLPNESRCQPFHRRNLKILGSESTTIFFITQFHFRGRKLNPCTFL